MDRRLLALLVIPAVALVAILVLGADRSGGPSAASHSPAQGVSSVSSTDMAMNSVGVITVPLEIRSLSSGGDEFDDAVDAGGVYLDSGWLGVSLFTNDFDSYRIDRSFLEAQIPEFVGRRIEEVSLSLVPCIHVPEFYEPLPSPVVVLHLGTWQGDLTGVSESDLWGAWDAATVLGRYDAKGIYGQDCELSDGRQGIAIDVRYAEQGKVLRLAVRDSDDTVDMREDYPEHSRAWYARMLDEPWLELVLDVGGAP